MWLFWVPVRSLWTHQGTSCAVPPGHQTTSSDLIRPSPLPGALESGSLAPSNYLGPQVLRAASPAQPVATVTSSSRLLGSDTAPLSLVPFPVQGLLRPSLWPSLVSLGLCPSLSDPAAFQVRSATSAPTPSSRLPLPWPRDSGNLQTGLERCRDSREAAQLVSDRTWSRQRVSALPHLGAAVWCSVTVTRAAPQGVAGPSRDAWPVAVPGGAGSRALFTPA